MIQVVFTVVLSDLEVELLGEDDEGIIVIKKVGRQARDSPRCIGCNGNLPV